MQKQVEPISSVHLGPNVEETELSMHTTNFEGRVAENTGTYKHNCVLTLYSRQ